MDAIMRISSSVSEPWVAWTMVLLLLLIIVANGMQRGVIVNSFRGLRTAKERDNLFDVTMQSPLGQVCLNMYKIGIFTLTLYTLLAPSGTFSWLICLRIGGIIVGLAVGKFLLVHLLGYIFFNTKTAHIAVHHYTGITTCCAILLYPILLFMLFVPQMGHTGMYILCGIVGLFYLSVLLMKIFQFFFTQPLASFYIFLYLCTLEAIPLIGLFCLGNYVVN